MLTDEYPAIDRHDVVARECFLKLTPSKLVVSGLPVGGEQYGIIDDEEGGIGGRQAMAVFGIIDRSGKGKGDEAIRNFPGGRTFEHAEGGKLLLHGMKGLIMLVGGIRTLDVSDGVVGAETGKGVDMAVGVVACKKAVVKPEDTTRMKTV